jgi:hypothetical protein
MESAMFRTSLVAAVRLALIAGLSLGADEAVAASRKMFQFNSVSLACWIENEKVIAVVNSTGRTLAAGSVLSVDAVAVPDGEHFIRSKTIARTPSGGIIRIGAVPSSSCTASVTLPLPDLKAQ